MFEQSKEVQRNIDKLYEEIKVKSFQIASLKELVKEAYDSISCGHMPVITWLNRVKKVLK